MKYYYNLFIFQYLIEGNAVNDEGDIDPVEGKHKIKDEVLANLKDLKWFSVFWDLKHNSEKAEYQQSSKLISKVLPQHNTDYCKSKYCSETHL